MPEAGAPVVSPLSTSFRVRVKAVVPEMDDIKRLALRAMAGEALPPFTAGAPLDLHLPTGPVRSCCVVNAETERRRYFIGAPRNRFRLDETAPPSARRARR